MRTPLTPTVLFAMFAGALLAQTSDKAAYLNPDLSPEKRAADLVSRMTLEEKVLQMQDQAPALSRLNIPAYGWWNEALHGVARAGQATVFPQAIGLAATWDTDLMHRVGDIISTEARAKYNQALRTNNHDRYFGLTFWSPNINIFRDPRWGRGQETYGEDPFLTGRMAVAFIKGMQGDDPHYFKVVATAKHYAVHSGPEPIRHKFDVHPSERDLNDTYLPAFRASVMEGKVDSIMCAYNSINGLPACVNTDLLQTHLKQWGFNGFIVSDCGAIRDIYADSAHNYKPNSAEADAVAVKAGTDLTCGQEYKGSETHPGLVEAVKQGFINEAEMNAALGRLFVARFKLGMFDPPERVPFSKIPYSEADSAEHRKTALEAARKSIVLLKNQNQTLPLKATVKKIAVIGPSADDPVALLGNYNGFSSKVVTPLAGIQEQFKGKAEVRYSPGATYTSQTQALIPASVLTPPNGAGHGFLAEYFDNADFQGAPKLSRVEARINHEGSMPEPAMSGRAAAVRWTATLKVPVGGDYQISGRGGFGPSAMHVFLDDKELTPPTPAAPQSGAGRGGMGRGRGPQPIHVQLEAGKLYKLRAEYKPNPDSSAQLTWLPPSDALLADAIDAVKASDVTVLCVGLNSNLEGEEMGVNIPGFQGGDRTDLNLPDSQELLLEAAVATGKPVIVVLTTGSAVALNYAAEHAPAVLAAWYGGEEIGTALGETLAGANNPAGRLPVTFYRDVAQLPPFEDYNMKGRTYRYFKSDPLYAFGYGLSYSTFVYSNLKASRDTSGGHVSVRVKNNSALDGDEVVQLYMDGAGGADDPIRSLRAFQRVHLKAGESRDVQFTIAADDVPKAKTKINVGGGQPVAQIAHLEGVL